MAAGAPEATTTKAPRLPWGIQTFVLTLVFVTVLGALGVYQVWHRHRVYTMARQLSEETLKYRALLDENRRAKLELATLKRFERVRSEAAQRLGMRVPAPQDVIEIR